MKEITVEPLLDKHFKTKETCSMVELYHLVQDYREKHPDVYVMYDRDYLHTVIDWHADKFYWDAKVELIRKQHEIKCPCCETKFRMYPDDRIYTKIYLALQKKK